MPKVLCCMCGVLMESNAANTCSTCLASKSDITRGISTEATLHQCRGCGRWHKDAGKWVACELESRELMGLCLGHVSGLKPPKGHASNQQDKIRLVDAGWIWTEPHSMRLKVRLTVQREVQAGTILQQSFTANFTVRNQQCLECAAEFRQGTWKSVVQVRQRVTHKRTFLYLEQLILKHGAHRGCLSIETFRDGMDFYFPDKGKAARFICFLESVVPIKLKTSKKLISTDIKSNIANYKFTNLAEICPLCKDDLLYLPAKTARNLGNIARLVLVKNISEVIHLLDPLTGQTASMSGDVFWRDPLRPIVTAARSRMTRYVVLGKEAVFLRQNASQRTANRKQRSRLARLTLAREEDLGSNDAQYEEQSHVGYLMKAGDVCLGYDLKDTALSEDDAETVRANGGFPNVIVIRKLYGGAAAMEEQGGDDLHDDSVAVAAAAAKKNRIWRLKRLQVKAGDEDETMMETGERMSKKKLAKLAEQEEMDEEDFMREVEADKEMRQNINLYKAQDVIAKKAMDDAMDDEDDDDDEDDQAIQLEELLDNLVLDDPADKPTAAEGNAAPAFSEDGTLILSSMYEEGERAAKDGIHYVSREDVRNVRDKDAPVVVTSQSKPGKDFSDLL
uniref:60S ribosomal export protein NMD3 n=1 Tax=Entomoneis paludosa TaxID=265537 RepID=A0A7S2Y9Y5_9STRA|eukprot:CAMPEP_0172453408 /NCGR_PEP_ID=MMETSP1065-20121228/10741_1 /TAXON_ID=265537 /ORGANISM="Amphiprora paludosa, Strain CCMP125" /LENGTH=618 /DNA_ID=CAMNT_0013205587 /DNA_START=15 /DNA_END=1871 /DNA_ORIENTATION=+